MQKQPTIKERFRGAMLGMAAGDALGTTIEFKKPGTFEAVIDIVGGGPFNLRPGQWTDDTSMGLCLAESLGKKGMFHPDHIMDTFIQWWGHGHLSSTGDCFDIGFATRHALREWKNRKKESAENQEEPNPFCGSTDPNSAGNGCIMRLAPVPLFYYREESERLRRMCALSARLTHAAKTCEDATAHMGFIIQGILQGRSKEEVLSDYSTWGLVEGYHPEVIDILRGDYKRKDPPSIAGTGYVVKSLEAALWAFYNSNDFYSGALLAVNLGDDADTTGAVYGQIAGAYYGEKGIPEHWRKILARRKDIEKLSDNLYAASEKYAQAKK